MKNRLREIIAVCLIAIIILPMMACGKEENKKSGSGDLIPGSSITPAPKISTDIKGKGDSSPTMTGVLTFVNLKGLKMHFVDISSGTEYEVPYTGGTDIQDSYGKIKAARAMKLGEIYDVYVSVSGKATKIYGSKKAWERNDITGITLDEDARKIGIGASNIVYEPFTVVESGGARINIAEIVDQDKIVIRGIGDKAYSLSITQGHGFVQFTGIDAFLGGYVSVGDRQLCGVTKDMLVTAPEGTQVVDIRCGSKSAAKTVTVPKNGTVSVDFSEFKVDSVNMGSINFSVTPEGAIMTIDGKEVDYSKPVSLPYGSHKIKLIANHYNDYTTTIIVNQNYVTKIIDMTATGTGSGSNTTTSTTSVDNTSGYSVSIKAPEGAALYVDSEYIGIIPCSFKKSVGKKTITLTKNGYNTISYTVNIPNAAGDMSYSFPDMVSGGIAPTVPSDESPSLGTSTVTVPAPTTPTAATIKSN